MFLGTDYAFSSPPSPTFLAGALNISDAFFAYDLGPGIRQGIGDITYTKSSQTTTTTPESSFAFGLAALALGATLKRKLTAK